MRKMRDEVICAMRQAFGFYSSQIRRKNLTARWRNTSLWLKGCYRYRLRVNVPLPGKFNFDVGINEKNRATQRKEKREREGRKKKRKTKLGQDCHFKFEWEFFLLFFLFFFSLSLFFLFFFGSFECWTVRLPSPVQICRVAQRLFDHPSTWRTKRTSEWQNFTWFLFIFDPFFSLSLRDASIFFPFSF